MARPGGPRLRLVLLLVAGLASVAAALRWGPDPSKPSSPVAVRAGMGAPLSGAPRAEAPPPPVDPGAAASRAQRLDDLPWGEVAAVASHVGARPALVTHVLRATETPRPGPARYLRGLLLMGRGDLEAALSAFSGVPVRECPAVLAYAPYRLHGEIRRGVPNPWRDRMREGVATRELPPLLVARFEVDDGRPRRALEAYLRTDPAHWVGLDTRLFGVLLLDSGVRNETWLMLRAAMRGGRVPRAIRPALDRLVVAPGLNPTPAETRARFLEAVRRDPALRRATEESARRLLGLRQRFVRREFGPLLRDHAAVEPTEQTDEAVLLLTVAAAGEKDLPRFETWSRELRRRTPVAAVDRWVAQLRAEAFR